MVTLFYYFNGAGLKTKGIDQMIDIKQHKWWTSAIVGVLIWLVLEIIATWLHVWAMKKAGVCPYITEARKAEKRQK